MFHNFTVQPMFVEEEYGSLKSPMMRDYVYLLLLLTLSSYYVNLKMHSLNVGR